MELQRTTAGDSRPASNERHRRRLVCPRPTHFSHRRSLTNTIEKPDCDTSAEKFFHLSFLSPRRVSRFPSSSTHCNHPRKYFQRTLKSKEWLLIFCAPASVPPKQCSTAHFSLKKAHQNTSPLSGKNALLFPLRPPFSDRRRAQRCGERTSRVCTHPRASVGFRFLPSPFTTGPQQPDSSCVGGEDAAHFRPSPPLPACAARVKVEAQKPSPLTH